MTSWFGWLDAAAIAIALFYLGMLSRRLGKVTHSLPYYMGLFVSAIIVALSPIAQITNNILNTNVEGSIWWALIYNGLPAFGLTLGISFAWRYWSWLFAERD
jgi:hypothetical protein